MKAIKSHDLKNAVDALLAGKPVSVPTTRSWLLDQVGREAEGCGNAWRNAMPSRSPSSQSTSQAWPSFRETRQKKLLLVNLWATWCGPCVSELPELVTMNRMYRGRNFQFVTISMDDIGKRDEALKVLGENHVAATNFILSEDGRDSFAEKSIRIARPSAVYAPDSARRQDHLSQDGRHRADRGQAGHRRLPGTNREVKQWTKTFSSTPPERPEDSCSIIRETMDDDIRNRATRSRPRCW